MSVAVFCFLAVEFEYCIHLPPTHSSFTVLKIAIITYGHIKNHCLSSPENCKSGTCKFSFYFSIGHKVKSSLRICFFAYVVKQSFTVVQLDPKIRLKGIFNKQKDKLIYSNRQTTTSSVINEIQQNKKQSFLISYSKVMYAVTEKKFFILPNNRK